MANKEWTPGNVEEWSVHAQLSFTPQTGNITLTANEGPSRDSGYSSERLTSPRGLLGARATCTVTVGGHHSVTLTCSDVPDPPPTHVHQVLPTGATPQVVHFCHHPPPDKPHRHYQHYHPPPTPPPASTPAPQPSTPLQECLTPPLLVLKDAASQTSTSNVPQVVQEQTKKRKARPYQRSPARARGSPVASRSNASSAGSDGKKNPRTVHIDVYCTGSESSSTSDDDGTSSTPQTVFESNQVKVMHSRAHSDSLPHALQRQRRRVLSNSRLDILPKEASGSTLSSSYPSPRSSLVSNTTGGFSLASESTLSSRFSSVNNSSVATSWKDTDLESTQTSLLKSDSFDYENSFDKLRIRQKEKLWGAAQKERRRLYKMAQESNSSESSDEEEGLAWSFGRYEDIQKRHNVKREDTVRRQNHRETPIAQIPTALRKSGSLSDSEAANLKKFKPPLPPTGRPPVEHWAKAEKFGPLVNFSKKPGHHVGPSKNPDCSCETCKYFFEHICFRNRTRSLGNHYAGSE